MISLIQQNQNLNPSMYGIIREIHFFNWSICLIPGCLSWKSSYSLEGLPTEGQLSVSKEVEIRRCQSCPPGAAMSACVRASHWALAFALWPADTGLGRVVGVSLCWSGLWQLGINLGLLTMDYLGDSHKSLTVYWYIDMKILKRAKRQRLGPEIANHHQPQIIFAPQQLDSGRFFYVASDWSRSTVGYWCFGVPRCDQNQIHEIPSRTKSIPSYILIKSRYYLAIIQV